MSEKKEDRKKGEGREGVKFRMRSVEGAGARTGTCLTMAAIALALALCVCAFAQSALAAQISVVPAYQEVRTGENFTVSIYVDPEGTEILGASYHLYFNNTLLNATAQAKGPFLGDNTWVKSEINNSFNSTHGIIKYGETILGGSAVTQPGVLANITFQAIAEENGVSELRLEDDGVVDFLVDSGGNPVSNVTLDHGNVSVRVGICGDVDNDGYITGGDATKVWDVATHVSPGDILDNPWAADVDSDGYITGGDATKIWDVATHVSPESILDCP